MVINVKFVLQVYVDEERKQRIRPRTRTKVLLHDLPLDTAFSVGVESNGAGAAVEDGAGENVGGDSALSVSERVTVRYEPEMLGKIGKIRQPPPVPTQGQ